MNSESLPQSRLSDDELLAEVARLAASERTATVRLIAALAEVDGRRLYLGQGCSSLFGYCTRVLHFSEHAAYGRIEGARAARRWPSVLGMLESGALTLTSLSLLVPHLSDENHEAVLSRARYRSKREVEEIAAALRPRPDVPSLIRRLPQPAGRVESHTGTALPAHLPEFRPSSTLTTVVPPGPLPRCPRSTPSASPARRPVSPAVVAPLSTERYKLQVTVSRQTRDKLRRVQDLIRHSVPSGDLAEVLDRALDLLLADLERRRLAATLHPQPAAAPRPGSRHIPAAVRRAVWRRDEGRCAFIRGGRRCDERTFIQFHHVRPFEAGGGATEDNIQLRCRAHNQYEADLFCGEAFILRERASVYAYRLGPDRAGSGPSSEPHAKDPASASSRAERP